MYSRYRIILKLIYKNNIIKNHKVKKRYDRKIGIMKIFVLKQL